MKNLILFLSLVLMNLGACNRSSDIETIQENYYNDRGYQALTEMLKTLEKCETPSLKKLGQTGKVWEVQLEIARDRNSKEWKKVTVSARLENEDKFHTLETLEDSTTSDFKALVEINRKTLGCHHMIFSDGSKYYDIDKFFKWAGDYPFKNKELVTFSKREPSDVGVIFLKVYYDRNTKTEKEVSVEAGHFDAKRNSHIVREVTTLKDPSDSDFITLVKVWTTGEKVAEKLNAQKK